jgi:malate dehydrogenase
MELLQYRTRMAYVAIVGAGELGGLLAHGLARRQLAADVGLFDEQGRVAEGKALDIMQAAPVEAFASRVSGGADMSRVAGASVVVLADTAGPAAWSDDAAIGLIGRIRQFARDAVIVCAAAAHRDLVDRSVRELRVPHARIAGSAPEALASGARALIALELDGSARDVSLSILGVPPDRLVIPWDDASAAGAALTRVLDVNATRRVETRLGALWPPGPYALAQAAAKTVAMLLGRSRQTVSAFVVNQDGAGLRVRAAALPVRRAANGLLEIVEPALGAQNRVRLDNAMGL